jgi:hypothetical protein
MKEGLHPKAECGHWGTTYKPTVFLFEDDKTSWFNVVRIMSNKKAYPTTTEDWSDEDWENFFASLVAIKVPIPKCLEIEKDESGRKDWITSWKTDAIFHPAVIEIVKIDDPKYFETILEEGD